MRTGLVSHRERCQPSYRKHTLVRQHCPERTLRSAPLLFTKARRRSVCRFPNASEPIFILCLTRYVENYAQQRPACRDYPLLRSQRAARTGDYIEQYHTARKYACKYAYELIILYLIRTRHVRLLLP